jgi:hypothetical protein
MTSQKPGSGLTDMRETISDTTSASNNVQSNNVQR